MVPRATDEGISSTTAAVALGLMGGFSIPGRLIAGFASDRFGGQKILAVSLFGMGLSVLWLVFLNKAWMLYCFVLFYGVCHGSRIPANFGILTEFFGLRSIGELIGVTAATAMLVGAFAPYMAGFIFDTTGSYRAAFGIVIAFLLMGGLITLTIKKGPNRSNN
jgi:MFS family permease